MQKNPSAANKYVNDPRMMQVRSFSCQQALSGPDMRWRQVLGVLLGVNISTAEPGQAPQAPQQKKPEAEPEPDTEMTGAFPSDAVHDMCWPKQMLTRWFGADAEKAEKELKASAQKEKELGNECYKARRTAPLARSTEHD